jgi:hypothetical protein
MWCLRERKKRNRKLCVHPIFTFILTSGAFFTLFGESGKGEWSLFDYFSSCISCSELHKAIQDPFQKLIQNMKRCLIAKEGLAVALRYMCEIHGYFAVNEISIITFPFKCIYCQCTYGL